MVCDSANVGLREPGLSQGSSNAYLKSGAVSGSVVLCVVKLRAMHQILQTLFTRNDPALLSKIEGYGDKNSGYIAELRKNKSKSIEAESVITRALVQTAERLDILRSALVQQLDHRFHVRIDGSEEVFVSRAKIVQSRLAVRRVEFFAAELSLHRRIRHLAQALFKMFPTLYCGQT